MRSAIRSSGVRIRPPRKKKNFKCPGVWRRYGRYQDRMAEVKTSVNKVSRSISRHIVPQWESFPFWRRHPSGITLRLLAFITLNQLKTSNFTQVGGFPVLPAVNWPLEVQYYFEGFPLVRIDLNDWRARREGGRGGLAFFTIPTCFLLLMIPPETLNEHAIQSIKFSPYILNTIICIVFIFNCHQLPTTWDSLRKSFSF